MESGENTTYDTRIFDFDRLIDEAFPLFGTITPLEFIELVEVVDKCIERVQVSTSPREMVLETWLLVDYCVRDLLLTAFDLKLFNHEDYDLRYELLPKSFQSWLLELPRILKVHQTLRPPQQVHTVSMTGHFALFFCDYNSNVFDQLMKAQKAYLDKYHPDFVQTAGSLFDTRRYISEDWLEAIRRLSDDWFHKAEKLNSVRNIAAHTYDENRITSKLGLSGPNATEHTRQWCLDTIQELVGILPKPHTKAGD